MSFVRPEIIRPPSEWASYFLPLTRGCSNNTCTFCNWHGTKLQMRKAEDVKKEIDAMALYVNHHVHVPGMPDIMYAVLRSWDGRRVFLQDGDALVYPYQGLVEVLDYLNSKFPALERTASYATPMDVLRTDLNQLEELKEHKLGILYMGIESGDDEVLKNVCKGVTHDQIVEAGRKVKQSGILLSVTVILGLGGVEGSEQHARETARILTEIDPDYAGALTLTIRPGTPLYQQWRSGEFHAISPFESLRELKMIVELARFSNCFFSSMHASNYLAIRGTLPQEKEQMIQALSRVIDRGDQSALRPEFLRGL